MEKIFNFLSSILTDDVRLRHICRQTIILADIETTIYYHLSLCSFKLFSQHVGKVYIRGVATGVDISIYNPKISPSKLFMG